MNKRTMGVVLLSGMAALLAGTIAVGATYALWSDKTTVETHLTSGNLEIKLERMKLTKCTLDNSTGYLATTNNDEAKDFTTSTTANANVFDIADGELIVPGAYYEAKMKLTNVGSVAFTYAVTLKLTDDNPAALASQLKFTFDGTATDHLYTDANKGVLSVGEGSLDKNDAAKEFTVKIEFENLDANNSAMDQKANFDLIVEATQKTAA